MTTKNEVDLNTYLKRARVLEELMVVALEPRGDLHPVLRAVADNHQLRLDIRYRRFNVYYRGGNLMCVDGRKRKSLWALQFDEKYFKGGYRKPPTLPTQLSGIDDAHDWVHAFPELINGMDEWWKHHSRSERDYCQAMAAANSWTAGPPSGDYFVLDLEYEWGKRRFDMIAAKRRPTKDDATGWVEPDLVFIEVKSVPSACIGKSGLGAHALDYQSIITASDGRHVKDIKLEYQNVIAQKSRLGLLDTALRFKCFSPAVPELLMVFIDIEQNDPKLLRPLHEVREVSGALGNAANIRFMWLYPKKFNKKYTMTAAVSPLWLVA